MKHYYLLLLLLGLSWAGRAQGLDPSFQSPAFLNQNSSVRVQALAAQADGKPLVAGDFQVAGGTLSNNVLRLNADNSRDLTFRPGPGASGPVQALAAQADGTVLIGGSFAAYAGTPTGPVARLLPTGELDPTFQLDPRLAGGQVAALVVQADGRILVGGPASASLPGGLVRLLPSGALDPSFGSGVGAGSGGQVLALAVQPADGKVLVAGAFTSFGGRTNQSLVRLLPSGAPDASFAAPSLSAATVLCSVALHPSGDILAGGYWLSSLAAHTAVLKRFQPSGAPDPLLNAAFGNSGQVRSVQIDASGRILVAGTFTAYTNTGPGVYTNNRPSVVRLLNTGEPDPAFPPTSYVAAYDAPDYYALLPLASGQVLLGGQVPLGPAVLNLLSAAGTPVASPNLGLQWRGAVSRAVPLRSGQLLLSGTYTSLNGQAVTQPLQRLHADGSFDQELTLPPVPLAFLPRDPSSYDLKSISYSGLFPQPTGEVYAVVIARYCSGVGGCITTIPTYRPYLCRVLATNTLDPSFISPLIERNLNGSLGSRVYYVLFYPTGELLVAFQGGPGYTPRLLKLQASGAASTTFAPPAFMPTASVIDQLFALANGGALVSYHLASGESQLVRLLPDGRLDPSFTLGASPALPAGATFSATLLQPDGKLLVSGNFTSFAGAAAPAGAVRLHPDGSVDASFQPVASLAPLVPLAALPDGRLLVRANSQPGTARLVRLLPNGSADPSFASLTVTSAGYPVMSWNVVLQPTDSKPVLYGDFEAVNSTPRSGLARLTASVLATRSGQGVAATLGVHPNPAHGRATLALPDASAQPGLVLVLDAVGREVRRQALPARATTAVLDLAGLVPGFYLVRADGATARLVVE